MRRVLVPELPPAGEQVTAGREESHHVLHVLRARPGERFRLADGAGGAAIGALVSVHADGAARFRVEERLPDVVVPVRVVLLGVPKPALLEEAVTLGTEGGATRFVLVRARYSPPGEVRADRLERVLRAAVTQCGRPDVPAVIGPLSLDKALDDTVLAVTRTRLLATPAAGPPPAAIPDGPAAVAIGPEGGWWDEETATLTAAGFAPLGLGPFVLRTPSAVGAALARLWS